MLTFLLSLLLAAPKQPETLSPFLVSHAEAAPLDLSTSTLRAFAEETARTNGLDVQHFLATLQCESGFNYAAVGDKGTSIGIAQLHFPSRDWGISTSTALDPYASIQIMAEAWKRGEQVKWSCYGLTEL
jgi:hypothetical protein